jgi:N-acetyl-gamma-glutamyl-phosphate reductase
VNWVIKVGIVGDGYTAEELVRLLARHPEAEVMAITSLLNIGRGFDEVFPNLKHYTKVTCESMDLPSFVDRCDAVIVALPHGQAVPVVKEVVAQGKKVVDLGADFRFKQVDVYESWYNVKHEAPDLLKEAVYGIPELYGDQVRNARIVANPGCFPTSAILGLAPALKAGLLDTRTLIVDAKTGVSGAGRTPGPNNLFCEANENVKAYNVCTHRHSPEIEQVFSWLAGQEAIISFTPHLIPMSRGILSTIYGSLIRSITRDEIQSIYEEFYRDCFFVRVQPAGQLPLTRAVYTSNHCDIGLVIDERTNRLVVISAIDNLVKGASGQAIQNLNLMFGLPETCGLEAAGLLP